MKCHHVLVMFVCCCFPVTIGMQVSGGTSSASVQGDRCPEAKCGAAKDTFCRWAGSEGNLNGGTEAEADAAANAYCRATAAYGLAFDCGSSGTSIKVVTNGHGCYIEAEEPTALGDMGYFYNRQIAALTCDVPKLCPTMVKIPTVNRDGVGSLLPTGTTNSDAAIAENWAEWIKPAVIAYEKLGRCFALAPVLTATAGNRVYSREVDKEAWTSLIAAWNKVDVNDNVELATWPTLTSTTASTAPGTHEALSEFAQRTTVWSLEKLKATGGYICRNMTEGSRLNELKRARTILSAEALTLKSVRHTASEHAELARPIGIVSMGGASAQVAWLLKNDAHNEFDSHAAELGTQVCGTEISVGHFWLRLGGPAPTPAHESGASSAYVGLSDMYAPLGITGRQVLQRLVLMGALRYADVDMQGDKTTVGDAIKKDDWEPGAGFRGIALVSFLSSQRDAGRTNDVKCDTHVLGGMDQTFGKSKGNASHNDEGYSGFARHLFGSSVLTPDCKQCRDQDKGMDCIPSGPIAGTPGLACMKCIKEHLMTDPQYKAVQQTMANMGGYFTLQAAAQVQAAHQRQIFFATANASFAAEPAWTPADRAHKTKDELLAHELRRKVQITEYYQQMTNLRTNILDPNETGETTQVVKGMCIVETEGGKRHGNWGFLYSTAYYSYMSEKMSVVYDALNSVEVVVGAAGLTTEGFALYETESIAFTLKVA